MAGSNQGGCITFRAPSTGSVMKSGSGVCHAITGSNLASSSASGWTACSADAVAELAETRDRTPPDGAVEVVEVAARHQEVGRRHPLGCFELGHQDGRVERHVDVVTQKQVARCGLAVEERAAVAAGAGGVEQLAVVVEVERARHVTRPRPRRARPRAPRARAPPVPSPRPRSRSRAGRRRRCTGRIVSPGTR